MRALLLALLSIPAFAHDGHDAPALHVHGWDGVGMTALAAAAGVVIWWLAKGRK